ncbi:LysR substrate-binding domain-containing protein [Herbaspirillum rubrisubalbicans]|uniref:LysR substrate-binding domain-containing protein n=1 Tax=Herbaspirillum rubrisubalbicans TaxID=80842 RepID=UPI003B8A8B30
MNVTSETLPIESCFPSTKCSKSELRIGSPLTSSSPRMLAKLVEQDLGIAILPKNMVVGTEFSHTLEQILPGFKLPSQPLYALTAPKYQSDLSRAFIRFLTEEWVNRVD